MAWLLTDMLGWSVEFHEDVDRFRACDGPKLNYGQYSIGGAMNVKACGWLSSAGMDPVDPLVIETDGMPALFPTDGGDLDFDPFASAFFQLSRYEEWTGIECDQHDRPITSRLHAARHNYLHRPVVDEWAIRLAEVWRRIDPSLP
ncbi:MAG TPA: hypothetical protein PK760_13735, partial [Flavobacteriales bacterium]|nr:hypothetical protein [Flavobacteriales bacterium]